jgi:adenylate cyclase
MKSARLGASRSEFEYLIPLKDAKALMKLRIGHVIKKRRYAASVGKRRFEIDVFQGDHEDLVIVEVELPTEKTDFQRPDWLGKEVTHNQRYYNASLALRARRK